MYNKKILKNIENKKNILDMIKVCNLTTKNELKLSELNYNKNETHDMKKFSLSSLNSSISNQNLNSLRRNNQTQIHLLKYYPKRLIKLNDEGKSMLPLAKIGGMALNLEKTFNSDDKKYKIRRESSKNLINNLADEKLINSNNDNEFKSTYFFKFSKISEEFKKLSNNSELIDNSNGKRIFEETFLKLTKLMENQNKLLFNYIDSNIINNNNNNISVINNFDISPIKINLPNSSADRSKSNKDLNNFFTYTSNNINTANNNFDNSVMTSTAFSSKNNNINIKKIIIFWSEFIILLNKFLSFIFNEFSLYKKENEKMKKKSYRDELILNNKEIELDDLKKYLNRFDVSLKINHQIQKEKEITDIKKEFKKKENEYMLMIYKLENEIKNLTILLDKNKYYYDEYKNISKEIAKNKRQKELVKIKFTKELQDANVKILIEKDNQDELNAKIEKLKEDINERKKEKEKLKTINIELQAKIRKLDMVIDEKEENILMLNEELEWYIRNLNQQKFKYNNFKNEFNILERKLYNLEEEKHKEK